MRLKQRIKVIEVLAGFGKEQNGFVAASGSIFDRFGSARFGPHDFSPPEPAPALKLECQTPRDADQFLALVTVSDVYPKSTVVSKIAVNQHERVGQSIDILLGGRFSTDLLRVVAVVSFAPIWRRGDASPESLRRQAG